MANWVHGRVFCRSEDVRAFQIALDNVPPSKLTPVPMFELLQAVPQRPLLDAPFIYEHTRGGYPNGEVVYDGFELSTFEAGDEHGTYVICWAKRDRDLERLALHMQLRKRTLEKLGVKELP